MEWNQNKLENYVTYYLKKGIIKSIIIMECGYTDRKRGLNEEGGHQKIGSFRDGAEQVGGTQDK